MIGNLICWVIALSLILSKNGGMAELFYTKMLFAMGFILLGTLSKAVDAYERTHRTNEDDSKTIDKNT